MPRGSVPGEQRGGRPPGIPNKATLQRVARAEQEMLDAKAAGRKLAKDVLDDFMQLFAGMAAHYQPRPNRQGIEPNPNQSEPLFEKYAKLAVEAAKHLAPYQSPTFRAIMIAPPPDASTRRGKVTRFSLTIFEGGPAGRRVLLQEQNGQVIDGQAIETADDTEEREP